MLILASASPRRKELLGLITNDFIVYAADTGEEVEPGLSPDSVVETLALRKARAVFRMGEHSGDTVIGSDTVVVINGEILGKPQDKSDAERMLRLLSGREHAVYTGVAVCSPEGERIFHDKTTIRFRKLTDREIADYVDSGDPMDKAGAYGIQGAASAFVEEMKGSLYNVIGLPVEKLTFLFAEKEK